MLLPETATQITAADILSATATLAATQAADPISEDGCGFNNADFPAGLALAASGDVLGSAALLFCYPRQAEGFGITREALAAFLPETISEKGRSEARLILSDARNNIAGKLAFSQISKDEVLFNGVRLSSDTTKFMKKLGATRTTTGYVLKTDKINALKGLVGAENILNVASLEEIASTVEQFTFVAPAAPKKFPFTVKVAGAAPAFYLNWEYASNNATFEAIKDIVKPMSSGFKSGLGWLMTPNQLVMASISLVEADLEGVDVSALLPHAVCTDPKLLDLRDEIRSGSMKVKVISSDEKSITLVIRKYDSVFVEACKAAQGRYNGEPTKSWTVSLISLPRIIATLLAFPRFDVSLLDPFIIDTIAAPAPVKREGLTNTPSGLPLFPHQIDDLAFLLQDFSLLGTKGGLLANDMGLGKTISSAVAAHIKCPQGRKLVVVPSVAKENWEREIHKFIGADQTVQVVSGRTDTLTNATWVVINYDIISFYKQALIDAGFSFVIMDEVHMLKNLKAQRTQALVSYWDKKTSKMIPGIVDSIPNVLPMSGTPMLNRPNELFSILRALGSSMGKSKSKFEERYCDGHFMTVDRTGRQVWGNTGATNSGELASNVSPFFRKVFKADVLNLPPKIRTSIPVEISKADRKMFDGLFNSLENASATDDNDEPTGEILRLIGILKHETAKVKVASTIEQAETIVQAGEKVIIFTCYTDTLNQIAAHFGSKAVVVDGSVTGPKRMAAVDAFQNNPEIQVFVGNVKAAGVAITLTAASYVIFNDRDWTPAMIFQAEDRAYRIGQTKMVNVYHMTAEGTFDEELVAALEGKSTLISGWEAAAISNGDMEEVSLSSVKKALFTYIENRKKSA